MAGALSTRRAGVAISPSESAWERLRYAHLLPLAGRGEAAAQTYASLVAAVEQRRDAQRRRVAEERIARYLRVSAGAARRIFRDALRSEAIEEADSVRFMRGGASLDDGVAIEGAAERAQRPRVYAALHFGSPVLAYLGLRLQREPELRVIARELDGNNPMPASKRDFARRKVAWVEATAGARFLDTDRAAVLRAREHLLAGRPLYAAVDVPGDVVARAGRVHLCGDRVLIASGIFHLAAMTGADVQMVVSAHRRGRIEVRCRPPVEACNAADLEIAVAAEVEAVVRELPQEWWMWPFLVV